jgi:hypothetical protein
MEIGGARLRGATLLLYSGFFFVLQKRGENFAQVLIHLVLQNNKKWEIVTLNNFFDFIVLQNTIEFNKFFFNI